MVESPSTKDSFIMKPIFREVICLFGDYPSKSPALSFKATPDNFLLKASVIR
jgi:hypothetical protein